MTDTTPASGPDLSIAGQTWYFGGDTLSPAYAKALEAALSEIGTTKAACRWHDDQADAGQVQTWHARQRRSLRAHFDSQGLPDNLRMLVRARRWLDPDTHEAWQVAYVTVTRLRKP